MGNKNSALLHELKFELGFSEDFLDSIEDGLLIVDTQGKIIIVNSGLCTLTGFAREELLGSTPPFPFWPPALRGNFETGFKKLLQGELKGEFEAIHVKKNGDSFPVSVFVAAIRDADEQVVAHLGLIQDTSLHNSLMAGKLSHNEGIFSALAHKKNYISRIEEKIRLKRLEYTLNNISDGIVSLDSDWCYTYVNKQAGELLGRDPASLVGKHIWTEFPEGIGLPFYKAYYQAYETQQKQVFQDYYEPFDCWFENRVYPSTGGLTIYFSNITEKKKAEELLRENEKYLDSILNNIGDPIFVKDDQSRLLLVNDAFCSIFGLSKADVLGKSLAEDVSPEERESFLKIDKEVLSTGIENVNEESLTVRGGETKIISTRKTRFIDEKGNRYLIGIIRDVTERKKGELELRAAMEYSEGLIDSMHEGLVVFDKTTAIIDVNPAFCKISGFTISELLGRECPYPFSPPEIWEESELRHREIMEGQELNGFETVYMRKDGSRFNADVAVSGIKTVEGNIDFYFATVVDTTQRKKAELDLKLAKEFTDNLVMSMQEGLIIVDLHGKIIRVNESTCNILGYTREELIGMDLPYPFARPEDFEAITKTNQKVARGEAPSFQFEFIRKNGERFLATFLTGTITNNTGEVIAMFGTMKDISEEYRAQRLLEEIAAKSTQKKDVILKLASLVGQDFETSLNHITKLASETLELERVSIWRFNDAKSEILCEDLYTQSTDTHTPGMTLAKAANPEYFEALEQHKSILIDDAVKNEATRKFTETYLQPNGIRSLMDVFINSAHGYYGILCFEHVGDEPRKWTADEQEFATSIANIVSLMVESSERKAAENKLIQTNKELSKANTELKALRNKLEQENIYLRNELDLVFNFEEMVYGSAEFGNVLSEIEKVAATNATVLLLGESGTGKELLARAIHNISLRNSKPLIKVNCSAIPRELIESELFGHKKGSFTGAYGDKIGKFELADGGTLFLDEIGELPLDMQPKILRFLQEGEIEVVGGTGIKKLDVRIIAATNRNLKEETEKKRFREDLYFRLNVFPIEVPPLRERKADIPLLVEHFMDKFNKQYAKNIKYVADEAMEKLLGYDWPGNIRELENLIERASILSGGDTLIIPGFESEGQKSRRYLNTNNFSLEAVQRNHILSVLEKCNWKISGPDSASQLLELKPSTLRDKMAKLGIKK